VFSKHAHTRAQVGVGGTCAWRLCGIEPTSSYAVYFDVVNPHSNPIPPQQLGMVRAHTVAQNCPLSRSLSLPYAQVQFQTQFVRAEQRIMRVTTVARGWADPSAGIQPLATAFDQV
jgi:protein transport protein SEC23